MTTESEYVEALKHDFETMLKMVEKFAQTNRQIREHRDQLWRECIQLREQLKGKNDNSISM